MTSHTARSTLFQDGCALSWFAAGVGEPVVLIQGMGIGAEGWTPQIPALSAEFRCLAFDNRGFGASQPLGATVTVERMAADAIALMDARGWTRAHLVGHSLGGLIALVTALTYPERARSLALLCTFADGRIATGMSPQMMWVGMRTRIGTRRMRRNAFLEMVMPPAVLDSADRDALAASLAPLFSHDLADQPPVVMKQLAATRKCNVTVRLGEIAVPTLVVSATHDIIAPTHAGRAIAEGIRDAQFVEVQDAAHGVTLQRPDVINALLLEHLRNAS